MISCLLSHPPLPQLVQNHVFFVVDVDIVGKQSNMDEIQEKLNFVMVVYILCINV